MHLARPFLLVAFCLPSIDLLAGPPDVEESAIATRLAASVTIHRDAWGTPHIYGETDEAACFGMGYAQCEDYFWQLEDNCIRASGRYAEVRGPQGLREDVLNRSFEVVRRSREDYELLAEEHRRFIAAFTHGINFWLARHPEVKPRLIQRFEPWQVIAMDRHLLLSFLYGRTHAGRPRPGSFDEAVDAATGSNQWAIAGARTASGRPMLFINPHQPWYGRGVLYEAHLASAEGLNFTGACFYGNPIPFLGFNEHLGWAYTVNDPDIADAYRVVFDDPENPLRYRYGDGHRIAREWRDRIRVREAGGVVERSYVFRATHHGPVVKYENGARSAAVPAAGQPVIGIAARIARLFDRARVDQAVEMIRARSFDEWRRAVARCAIPMFNIAYADCAGNIFYVYNGAIPIRDPAFDWTRTVDGSDPRTEWRGFFPLDDLPQVLNPPSGYVQNCNSTPFRTTEVGNPFRRDFPAYILEDGFDDKRRAQVSRMLLGNAENLSFEALQALAFDTTLYWAVAELPRFERDFVRLAARDAKKAARVKPYLEHLLAWDRKASRESTAAGLCIYWYLELYGEGYPAETLRSRYRVDRLTRFDALLVAAEKLESLHGSWKVPWGNIHRLQRVTRKQEVIDAGAAFNGLFPNLPCAGGPGPLGVVFTCYSAPGVPVLRPARYVVVGASYIATVEFGDKVRGASLVPYGQSADRSSPHFFDQAKLMSEEKLKPAWLYREDVLANAKRSYRPGAK